METHLFFPLRGLWEVTHWRRKGWEILGSLVLLSDNVNRATGFWEIVMMIGISV